MSKRISASDAKNNFGGLLEDVAALGRVEIIRHGRLVAVVLSPRMLDDAAVHDQRGAPSSEKHMIPPERARAARVLSKPSEFDDE